MSNEAKIGSLMKPKSGTILRCGTGTYPNAVVLSVSPFVLVSTCGTMVWNNHDYENFEYDGEPTEKEHSLACLRYIEELEHQKERIEDQIVFYNTLYKKRMWESMRNLTPAGFFRRIFE